MKRFARSLLRSTLRSMRQVVIHRGEDGFWVAEVPSLPGCLSQGATKEEAITNVREAIDLWIEAARDLNVSIPPEPFDTMVVAV